MYTYNDVHSLFQKLLLNIENTEKLTESNLKGTSAICKRRVTISSYIDPIWVDNYFKNKKKSIDLSKRLFFNGPNIGHTCTNEPGKCGCAHSEPRLIQHLYKQRLPLPKNLILISTYGSCPNCANILADSELFCGAVYKTPYLNDIGTKILSGSGIQTLQLMENFNYSYFKKIIRLFSEWFNI
jgi:hypothetical protein